MNNLGKQVPVQDLLDIFEPADASVNMYYGRIGNGKTYSATADILDLLSQGRVVYCNWHINYDGFDERNSFMHALYKFFGFRRLYFKFSSENLRYFSPDDVDIEFLSSLTDCDVFVDEGQWIFDSYEGTKFSKAKRRLILHTRHLNRSLNIISQRTQAIQVSARGQVNRFYRCEKLFSWPFLIFRRTEFTEMKDNDVDETAEPASFKTYFASKRVMDAYNSKYLRGGIEKSQEVNFEAFDLNFWSRTKLLLSFIPRPRLKARRGKTLGDNKLGASLKIVKSPSEGRVIHNSIGSIRLNDDGEGIFSPYQEEKLPF